MKEMDEVMVEISKITEGKIKVLVKAAQDFGVNDIVEDKKFSFVLAHLGQIYALIEMLSESLYMDIEYKPVKPEDMQ